MQAPSLSPTDAQTEIGAGLPFRADVAYRNAAKLRDETGSTLVEFAISAILLFTLIFGILDGSRALYVDHFVANAAQEGARYAMVRGASWSASCSATVAYNCNASSANIATFVQSIATAGVAKANITTTATWPGTNAAGASCTSGSTKNIAGCAVKVIVTYPFSFVVPLLPLKTLSLSSTSQVTIVE